MLDCCPFNILKQAFSAPVGDVPCARACIGAEQPDSYCVCVPIRAALLPDDLQLGIYMVEHECAADQLHSLCEVLLHLILQIWHQHVRQEVLAGCLWVADVYSRLHSNTDSSSPNCAVYWQCTVR